MKATIISIVILSGLLLSSCGSRVLTEEEVSQYTEDGQRIASETFGTLSSTLQTKMREGGPMEALSFCNVNAYPLTDSLSEKNKVTIKRTALKFRNPNNEPNEQEREVLESYQDSHGKGESVQPKVLVNENDQAVFYSPIFLAPNCVKCHGNPGMEIPDDLHNRIKEFYPNDQATGFAAGDLRGIWSITFRD